MVFSRRETCRRTAAKRLVTGAALLLVLAYAGFSQEQILPLELDPYKVENNDFIFVTMYVDHDVADEIEIEAPDLPPALRLYWGPRIRPVRRPGEYGPERVIEIVYKFRAVRTGWYLLEPFRIRIQIMNFFTQELVTEPVSFAVGVEKGGHIVIPPEPEWFIPRLTLYQGEALPITLKLAEREDIGIIRSFDVSAPDSGLFETISSYGEIEKQQVADRILYTLPVASYMFTPTKPGRVLIPSARVTLDNITGKAGGEYIEVLPLPKEAEATGALGLFRVSAWSESPDIIEENDEAEIHIRVEGEGNLNYFTFPEPVSEGGVLISREDEHVYTPSERGYLGFRDAVFRYTPVSAGEMTVSVPEFVWFDMDLNVIRTKEGSQFRFSVVMPEVVSEDEIPDPVETLRLKSVEEMVKIRTASHYDTIRSYAWLLPGIVLLVFCILMKNLKILFVSLAFLCLASGGEESEGPIRSLVRQGIVSYENGDYTDATFYFSRALDTLPDSAPLLYNLGITQYKVGDPGMAIYYLREANYIMPGDKEIREAVEVVEESAGLTTASQPLFRIHTNTFFLVFILLANGACCAAAVYYIKRKGLYAILFILLVVITVGAAGSLISSAYQRGRVYGVAVYDVPVKKIPGEKGEPWIEIKEGSSVRVLYNSEGYLFSELSPGLEGWIEEHNIRIINP